MEHSNVRWRWAVVIILAILVLGGIANSTEENGSCRSRTVGKNGLVLDECPNSPGEARRIDAATPTGPKPDLVDPRGQPSASIRAAKGGSDAS